MSLIIYFPFAMPWGCVWWHKTYCQKQWLDSDETVMQQWLNSDAFDLSFLMTSSSFWDVFDHILLFCNALGVFWWHKTFWQKQLSNSDETVMEQWWNSDGTAMALIRASEMSLIIFYPYAMPWEFVWWHNTFWQKQWSNSDETSDGTVMQQWLNSDAFDLSFLILISRF
jgi:hypothetical protein